MSTISAVLTSFNEERKIAKALKSVKWCDEIILVDGKSTDSTVKIAKPLITKLLVVPNDPSSKSMRNLGINSAKSEWILLLDSDEIIPKELSLEIKKRIKTNQYTGFSIPRKQYFLGKWIRHCGWYPDYQMRLFKKGSGLYKLDRLHEQISIKGNSTFVKIPFEHYSYYDWAEFRYKLNRYIRFEASRLAKRDKPPSAHMYLFIRPPAHFLSILFRLNGFLDGWRGFVLAFYAGYYELMIYFSYLKIKKEL
jgi:glycosyltransferase involved in cell wall biosynthesis